MSRVLNGAPAVFMTRVSAVADAGCLFLGDARQWLCCKTGGQAMSLKCASADDVLKVIKDNKVQMIDLRFTDLPGTWQHFSVPPSAVDGDAMNEGIGFDGSSIRGFQEIQ